MSPEVQVALVGLGFGICLVAYGRYIRWQYDRERRNKH